MKTFKENKNRIKIFTEALNENDEDLSGLARDLESLGVKDQTYSLSDIEDNWSYIFTKEILENGDYSETNIDEAYKTTITESGNECYFEVEFNGSIEIESVDEINLIKDFIANLDSSDDNYVQKRWGKKEIQEALEDVNWQDYIAIDSSEAVARVLSISEDGSNGTIEYEVDEDSYSIDADVDGMFDDFKYNLGI